MDVPEAMIANEVDRMMNEFSQRIQSQGLNLELYFQFSGQDEEALKAQMKEEAEDKFVRALTLEAIAEVENIEATDEDVEAELEKMAAMYNMDS